MSPCCDFKAAGTTTAAARQRQGRPEEAAADGKEEEPHRIIGLWAQRTPRRQAASGGTPRPVVVVARR